MKWYTEEGAPKSGKTTRLITKANTAVAEGKRVIFRNVEISAWALAAKGLDSRVIVVVAAPGDQEAVGIE